MRVNRATNLALWIILLLLLLNICNLLFRSSSHDFSDSLSEDANGLPNGRSGGDSVHMGFDSGNTNREYPELLNAGDSKTLRQLRQSRWQLGNVLPPNGSSGPVPLVKKQASRLDPVDRIPLEIEPHFLLSNISTIKMALPRINSEQVVLNIDLYQWSPSFVIVIQVHNRLDYLRLLIESLRRTKDIHRTLLVFSHDFYMADINRLVRSIGFAQVVQIFMPYTIQLFPNSFPGHDPNDCARDIKKNAAQKLKCINADHPDKYGHYREAEYSQTKHHWFWKLNFVFEHLRSINNFGGPILFLEEDHYVAEDLLHMLTVMDETRQMRHKSVDILCLGSYDKKLFYETDSAKYHIGNWVASFHNMGMTLDRVAWKKIKACTTNFCNFDDYNWDWSLQHISMKCTSNRMQVMVLTHAPRVFHIGECGVHHKKKTCSPRTLVTNINKRLDNNMPRLYPSVLTYAGAVATRARILKPNGGWGDSRDRNLCLSIVYGRNTVSEFPIKPPHDIYPSIVSNLTDSGIS